MAEGSGGGSGVVSHVIIAAAIEREAAGYTVTLTDTNLESESRTIADSASKTVLYVQNGKTYLNLGSAGFSGWGFSTNRQYEVLFKV